VTVLDRIVGRDATPWQPPQISAPLLLDVADLGKPLGEFRSRRYYAHKLGELVEDPRRRLTDDDILPSTPLVPVTAEDGTREYRVLKFAPPGTFAALTTVPTVGPKPPPASKPADLLSGFDLLNRQVPRTSAEQTFSIRGAEQIRARLLSKGITLTLTPDGAGIVITAPGGRVLSPYVEAVQIAAPLLVPFLTDNRSRALCTVTAHPEPVEALTMAAGAPPQPWCGACGSRP
jgi:hypothetical protein